MQFLKKEHFIPSLSNRQTREQWEEQGARSVADLAHEQVEKIISEHKVEPLDGTAEAELERIVREVEDREAK
jgi:trimethylamine:corrinoid methyltransferase-like protein